MANPQMMDMMNNGMGNMQQNMSHLGNMQYGGMNPAFNMGFNGLNNFSTLNNFSHLNNH